MMIIIRGSKIDAQKLHNKIDVPIARARRWMQHSARIDIGQNEDGALCAGAAHHVRANSTLQLYHFSFGFAGTDFLIQFLATLQQGLWPRARWTAGRIAAHDDDDAANKWSRDERGLLV
jgi:hypothetical protein